MSTPKPTPEAPPARQQILYVSRLVHTCRYEVFAAICRVARAHNNRAALRGFLLFDGHRFGQLIEGPAPAAHALMGRIAQDPRHTTLQLLANHRVPGLSTLDSWQPGFCAPDELDLFEGPQGPRGAAAVGAFCALAARADLSP